MFEMKFLFTVSFLNFNLWLLLPFSNEVDYLKRLGIFQTVETVEASYLRRIPENKEIVEEIKRWFRK